MSALRTLCVQCTHIKVKLGQYYIWRKKTGVCCVYYSENMSKTKAHLHYERQICDCSIGHTHSTHWMRNLLSEYSSVNIRCVYMKCGWEFCCDISFHPPRWLYRKIWNETVYVRPHEYIMRMCCWDRECAEISTKCVYTLLYTPFNSEFSYVNELEWKWNSDMIHNMYPEVKQQFFLFILDFFKTSLHLRKKNRFCFSLKKKFRLACIPALCSNLIFILAPLYVLKSSHISEHRRKSEDTDSKCTAGTVFWHSVDRDKSNQCEHLHMHFSKRISDAMNKNELKRTKTITYTTPVRRWKAMKGKTEVGFHSENAFGLHFFSIVIVIIACRTLNSLFYPSLFFQSIWLWCVKFLLSSNI